MNHIMESLYVPIAVIVGTWIYVAGMQDVRFDWTINVGTMIHLLWMTLLFLWVFWVLRRIDNNTKPKQ